MRVATVSGESQGMCAGGCPGANAGKQVDDEAIEAGNRRAPWKSWRSCCWSVGSAEAGVKHNVAGLASCAPHIYREGESGTLEKKYK